MIPQKNGTEDNRDDDKCYSEVYECLFSDTTADEEWGSSDDSLLSGKKELNSLGEERVEVKTECLPDLIEGDSARCSTAQSSSGDCEAHRWSKVIQGIMDKQEERIKKMDKTNDKLKDKNVSLEVEVQSKNSKLSQLVSIVNKLKETIASEKAARKTKKRELAGLKETLSQLEKEHASQKADLEEAKVLKGYAYETMDDLNLKVENLKATRDSQSNEISNLKASKRASDDEIKTLKAKIVELQNENSRIQMLLDKVTTAVNVASTSNDRAGGGPRFAGDIPRTSHQGGKSSPRFVPTSIVAIPSPPRAFGDWEAPPLITRSPTNCIPSPPYRIRRTASRSPTRRYTSPPASPPRTSDVRRSTSPTSTQEIRPDPTSSRLPGQISTGEKRNRAKLMICFDPSNLTPIRGQQIETRGRYSPSFFAYLKIRVSDLSPGWTAEATILNILREYFIGEIRHVTQTIRFADGIGVAQVTPVIVGDENPFCNSAGDEFSYGETVDSHMTGGGELILICGGRRRTMLHLF